MPAQHCRGQSLWRDLEQEVPCWASCQSNGALTPWPGSVSRCVLPWEVLAVQQGGSLQLRQTLKALAAGVGVCRPHCPQLGSKSALKGLLDLCFHLKTTNKINTFYKIEKKSVSKDVKI